MVTFSTGSRGVSFSLILIFALGGGLIRWMMYWMLPLASFRLETVLSHHLEYHHEFLGERGAAASCPAPRWGPGTVRAEPNLPGHGPG